MRSRIHRHRALRKRSAAEGRSAVRRSAAEGHSATRSARASGARASANRRLFAEKAADAAKWQELPQMRLTYAREVKKAFTNRRMR